MRKTVTNQEQWDKVITELENEYNKLAAYDFTIIEKLQDVSGLNILDYGSGPAIMASMLKGLGSQVRIYDLSKEMREICADKLGRNAVFDTEKSIPDHFFDVVLCNLVLCIVTEESVSDILETLARVVHPDGRVYIGFCNPKIYEIKESRLDYRFPIGVNYEHNHDYKKIKKEGNYEIIEKHRPIDWYKKQFKMTGLRITDTLFTPEYEMNGFKIEDFIIFELQAV